MSKPDVLPFWKPGRLETPSEILDRLARNTVDRNITKTEAYWRDQNDRQVLQRQLDRCMGWVQGKRYPSWYGGVNLVAEEE